MAEIKVKAAGKQRLIWARAMVTVPSSIGWRSICSTSRWNSGSSSRNNTPLCQRLASPGRGVPLPPSIRPASEILWSESGAAAYV